MKVNEGKGRLAHMFLCYDRQLVNRIQKIHQTHRKEVNTCLQL